MSVRAFIAFLRCEANQADERARALRTVAANIENHASADVEASRKLNKRKPTRDPNRPKRQHTAYTMYVTTNYESIKENNPDIAPKEMISMVARQWAQVSEEEKEHWRQRAMASAVAGQDAEVAEELAEYVDEELQGEDLNKKKRGAIPTKKEKLTVTVTV